MSLVHINEVDKARVAVRQPSTTDIFLKCKRRLYSPLKLLFEFPSAKSISLSELSGMRYKTKHKLHHTKYYRGIYNVISDITGASDTVSC